MSDRNVSAIDVPICESEVEAVIEAFREINQRLRMNDQEPVHSLLELEQITYMRGLYEKANA